MEHYTAINTKEDQKSRSRVKELVILLCTALLVFLLLLGSSYLLLDYAIKKSPTANKILQEILNPNKSIANQLSDEQKKNEYITNNQLYGDPNALINSINNSLNTNQNQNTNNSGSNNTNLITAGQILGITTSGNIGVITLKGTQNQIDVSYLDGTIIFKLAQDIGPTSSPTFNTVYLSSLSPGAIPVIGPGGQIIGDDNFFWDYTNHRLGIGTTSPTQALDVAGNINIRGGGNTIIINGIRLDKNSDVNSGASLVGLYDDNMKYVSENTNVQSAIKQLDSAIQGLGVGGTDTILNGIKYTWPTADGSSGQVLSTNGAGSLSWINLPTSSSSGTNYWQLNSGVLSPATTTNDLVLGASTVASALVKFAGSAGGNSFINTGGNLGIGTTNPIKPLEVTNSNGIRIGNISKYLDFFTSGVGNDINSSTTLHLNYSNNQTVSIGEGGTSNLFVSGNVGLGTTSASSRLYVNGNSYLNGYATVSASLAVGYPSVLAGVGNGAFSGNVGIGTSNPVTQFDVPLRIPTSPISSNATGTHPSRLFIDGKYAYVVAEDATNSFQIFDISNPSSVGSPVSTVSIGSSIEDVYVQGKYAYIATLGSMKIYDISNPTSPTLMSTSAPSAFRIYVQGRYAYTANGNSGTLTIYDVSNPSSTSLVGTYTVTGLGNVNSVVVQGRYAYITDGSDGLFQVIDVSDPTAPTKVGQLSTSINAFPAVVQGNYAYVVEGNNATLNIIDITTPSAPTALGSVNIGFNARDVYVNGRYAYVTTYFDDTIYIVDISNASSPVVKGTISLTNAFGVSSKGRYLYAISRSGNAFNVYDMGGAYIQNAEINNLEGDSIMLQENLSALDGNFRGGVNIGASLNVQQSIGTKGVVKAVGGFNGTCQTGVLSSNPLVCNQDVAEVYSTSEVMDKGDIVVVDQTRSDSEQVVAKAHTPGSSAILGIVSTSPGLVFNQGDTQLAGDTDSFLKENKAPIALSGKVPTKVSSINGVIHKGDLITASIIPGVGQKATKAGYVVGKALEDYTNPNPQDVGKIMVFVNLGYTDPGNLLANLTIDPNGLVMAPHLTDAEKAAGTDPSSSPDTSNSVLGAYTETPSTFSATLATLTDSLNSVTSRLSFLESMMYMGNASLSGILKEASSSYITGKSTDTSITFDKELIVNDDLQVLDKITAKNLGVTGSITAGLLVLNGLDTSDATDSASIGTVTGSLSLQPLATGDIEIENGKLIIDTNGNFIVKEGDIDVQKGKISGNDQFVGKVTLPKNQNQVEVKKSWKTIPSSILVTPPYDTKVWVTNITTEGFVVNVDNTSDVDEDLNWLAFWSNSGQ